MTTDDALAARFDATIAFLEAIVADRSLLERLTVEERTRFLTAAGDVYCPDIGERRRRAKARSRKRRADEVAAVEQTLASTGIRILRERRRASPNVFPPGDAAARARGRP